MMMLEPCLSSEWQGGYLPLILWLETDRSAALGSGRTLQRHRPTIRRWPQ